MNEHAILGACLVDETAMDKCLNYGCKHEWFSGYKERRLFTDMVTRHLNDEPTDFISMCADHKELDDYVDSFSSIAFLTGYLKTLDADYKIREVERVRSQDISGMTPDEAVSKISEGLTEIVTHTEDKSTADCMDDNIQVLDNAFNGIVSGVPLPWDKFSNATGGFQRGSVIPFVGRDGKGKSGAIAQCLNFWAEQDIPTLSFSFEDVKRRTLLRMGGCREWYSARTVETGRSLFNDRFEKICSTELKELKEKMLRYKEFIERKPFWIIDRRMNVEEICYWVKHYKRVHGVEVVTIDGFKDIIHSDGNGRTEREAHVAKTLQGLAKETNVAMPVVSHINKINEDAPISKIDVTGAGEQMKGARQVVIFQDAGVDGVDGENTFELAMTKSNFGGGGSVLLRRDESVLHYSEI